MDCLSRVDVCIGLLEFARKLVLFYIPPRYLKECLFPHRLTNRVWHGIVVVFQLTFLLWVKLCILPCIYGPLLYLFCALSWPFVHFFLSDLWSFPHPPPWIFRKYIRDTSLYWWYISNMCLQLSFIFWLCLWVITYAVFFIFIVAIH